MVRKVRTISAWATGPPLTRMFRMADPMEICRVRGIAAAATCRMSVLMHSSPLKWGNSGFSPDCSGASE